MIIIVESDSTDCFNMWPFKKRHTPNISKKQVETVICIPGNWENWNEFISLIVTSTDMKYMAAGGVLMNAEEKKHYLIEFCERDEKMRASFKQAGKGTGVTEEFLDQIEKHRYVIYISGKTGNLEEARHIAFAADAVLKAGGLGVKIESAGKAFEKNKWHQMVENYEEHNLYSMFVLDSIVDEDGTVYSCGMHNLGFKDMIISGEEFQEAAFLISVFGWYQIIDKPIIQNRQTFSPDAKSPRFRITEEKNQPYIGDKLFENPFGMWRLTKEIS